MDKNQFYKIDLEDYRFPRTASRLRSYYGTMEDLWDLGCRLTECKSTARLYADTIDALECYPQDQNVSHWIAGHHVKIMTPVEDICRYDIILKDQRWDYHFYNDGVCGVRAKEVKVSQILFRTEDGFERCIRAAFTGLQACIPRMGWYYNESSIKGFPGMVTWKNNVHTVLLFTSQQIYSPDEQQQAMADMTDPGKIRLCEAVGDIFGEV